MSGPLDRYDLERGRAFPQFVQAGFVDTGVDDEGLAHRPFLITLV